MSEKYKRTEEKVNILNDIYEEMVTETEKPDLEKNPVNTKFVEEEIINDIKNVFSSIRIYLLKSKSKSTYIIYFRYANS